MTFLILGCKNGFDLEFRAVEIVLQFINVLISGLHIALVTCLAALLFQSGWKAMFLIFVRYVVGGFVWGAIASGLSENIHIQFMMLDPFNCINGVFERELIMDNYWVMTGFSANGLIINGLIWFMLLYIIEKRRDY